MLNSIDLGLESSYIDLSWVQFQVDFDDSGRQIGEFQ